MGRFSVTVQIKDNVGRMRFINLFCDVMKRRGFVKCSEDEAALSYLLAFSEGWVTLASDSYADNSKQAQDDARQTAAEINTSAFSVEVVDSDFAILTLNTGDTVIVGDGSGYGFDEDAPKGDRGSWEQLLAEGRTWEQLSEIWEKHEIFVEDALYKSAPVLGIRPEYMSADHEELSGKVEGDKNIAALYFKKAADSKGKPMSLNAAFIKVFGDALEPLGFKRIKGRQPYFVRVVPGGEIIHTITITSAHGDMRTEKAFKVCGGVATIYRGKIDLTINPRNLNWLIDITDAYFKTHPFEDDHKMFEKINRFIYAADDYCSMQKELIDALGYTKQFLFPVLDEVTTLSECADFYWLFKPMILTTNDDKDLGMSKDGGQSEWLMLLKVYDTDAYEAKLREGIDRFKNDMLYLMNAGRIGYTPETLDSDCKHAEEQAKADVSIFDEYLNRPQLNTDVINELERRRAANTEILRSYGLNL